MDYIFQVEKYVSLNLKFFGDGYVLSGLGKKKKKLYYPTYFFFKFLHLPMKK